MSELDFDLLLSRINKKFTQNINSNLKEYDVTRTDVAYLLAIQKHSELKQYELAEKFDINTATVTRSLNKLEKKGLIKREEDSKDKRQKNVVLTDEGKNVLDRIGEKHTLFKKEIVKDFSSEEYSELLDLLNKLLKELEEY